jgi:serine/threonine protein kinase
MLPALNGRYELREQIGQGGMAVVYRGFDRHLNREVAIKLLKAEPAPTPKIIEHFEREAAATSKLSHPNVVNLYDFGKLADGRLFLVIELLRGRSLATLLSRQCDTGERMSWTRAVKITLQVCAALSAAHARGIVHHDITPANCFLLEEAGIRGDHVKVLDFGIARLLDGTQAMTLAQATGDQHAPIMGTPFYIAPEVLLARPTDRRVDIYGAGVLLYEMCTGQRPFQHENLFALLYRITEGKPVPPRMCIPESELSEAAEAIILRAMAREPADRFRTAEDLAEALEATMTEVAPRSIAASPVTGTETFVAPVATLKPAIADLGVEAFDETLQQVPSISTQAQRPLDASPEMALIAAPEPRAASSSQRELLDDAQVSTSGPSTRLLWSSAGLMLVLGAGLAVLVDHFRSPQEVALPQKQADVSPPDPAAKSRPGSDTGPVKGDPIATSAALETKRRGELMAFLDRSTREKIACIKVADEMIGGSLVLPLIVAFAADGSVSARVDDDEVARLQKREDATVLKVEGHACVLKLVQGAAFAPDSNPVELREVISLGD